MQRDDCWATGRTSLKKNVNHHDHEENNIKRNKRARGTDENCKES